MALPNNIQKEHLLKAIEKIESEGIPSDADSQYYDVKYNGKIYPPKVVVSYDIIRIKIDCRKYKNILEKEKLFKIIYFEDC